MFERYEDEDIPELAASVKRRGEYNRRIPQSVAFIDENDTVIHTSISGAKQFGVDYVEPWTMTMQEWAFIKSQKLKRAKKAQEK